MSARRIAGLIVLTIAVLTAACRGAVAESPSSLPAGVELPVQVRLSMRILNIVRLQEIQGELGATVEFTQRWNDPTLRFDRIARGEEHMDFVDADAQAQLARMWSPGVIVENMIGSPRAETLALSIFADGRVVMIRRLDGDFRVQVGMDGFPFDRQQLQLGLVAPRHAADVVVLTTTEFDRQYSSIEGAVSPSNWVPRGIAFRQDSFFGWNARPFSRLTVIATVDRLWSRYVLRLFVPFAAVMSLSLFLLWAPRTVLEDSHRATMVFSTLLALAALSFTFETSFPGSISMNSPVAFMISIGYFYLPFVLMIDLFLSRDGVGLMRRSPYLADEIRRNVRVTVPLLFVALCLVSLFALGEASY
jgi:hypothetical protein